MGKRLKLLAGNWKMNKLTADLGPFFEAFARSVELNSDRASTSAAPVEVLFAVPFTLLAKAYELAPRGVRIAAQNVHWESSGAFTGEVSLAMLKDVGIKTTLIGHSERRQYFGETDATVARKVRAALEQQVTPIVCVGELLEEREAAKTEAVITRQVEAFLEGLSDLQDLIIAYEPVWAIGTGRSATAAQAQEVHAFIRNIVARRLGPSASEKVRILYGGSATPANINELLAQEDIDGALVGGASLKPEDFANMVRAAQLAH